MSRTGMAERVRPGMFAGNIRFVHSPFDDRPHCRRTDRSIRKLKGHKDIAADAMRTAILQILQNRFADLKLDWILLDAAALCAPYSKGFVPPVEIFQPQLRDLAVAQGVDRIQQKHRPRTQVCRCISIRCPNELPNLRPPWSCRDIRV